MSDNIINLIYKIYNDPNLHQKVLAYANNNLWENKLKDYVDMVNVKDNTDLNYSKCLSFYITSNYYPKIRFGTDELAKYIIEKGEVNGITLEICTLSPYAYIGYNKYYLKEGPIDKENINRSIDIKWQNTPFDEETKKIDKEIRQLLYREDIEILEDEILDIVVPNIKLELKEENPTVYNCLFHDSF